MSTTRRSFLKTGLAAGFGSLSALSGWKVAGDDRGQAVRLVDEEITAFCEKAELSMLFRGSTAEQCRQWQRAFRAKLAEMLGNFEPPKRWDVVEEDRRKFDDHVRFELILKADGVPSVPVYLLVPTGASIPKGAAEKRPAVLCVHGHGKYGNHPVVGRTDLDGVAEAVSGAHYDYGLQFVRRGYVVAAPCMIPFGRRVNRDRYGGNDPCAVTFVRMLALGRLSIAANLRDLRWTIDLLQSRDEVDGQRIGCVGLSYGGRMTMLVSAMDERIKVAAVSGALNLLQERATKRYSCGSQIIPGLLKYGDYSEIGSLIAPRPCVWEVGAKDGLIIPKWADLFRNRLRRAYQALGASDQLQFDHFDDGHRWNGKIAYPLFERVLKG